MNADHKIIEADEKIIPTNALSNKSKTPLLKNKILEKKRHWLEYIPHPVAILFCIILLATLLTYIIPAGEFVREMVDGRSRVVPGTYASSEGYRPGLMGIFRSIPLGFKAASEIIFAVLAGGIMFGLLEKTGMVENVIGRSIYKLGLKRKYLIVIFVTFIYGLLGIAVGYENNIAMVPIAAVLAVALGGDLILAAGISVGAITVGFGLSPINPYTVGIGHKIGELPMFSGAILRSILCFAGLSLLAYYNVRYFKKIYEYPEKSLARGLIINDLELTHKLSDYRISKSNWLVLSIFLAGLIIMLFGIFINGWYINEISAIFLMIGLFGALASRMSTNIISETVLKSIGIAAPGAFMVGYATSIKEIMQQGKISDTICYHLSEALSLLPTYFSAIAMSGAQCVINLFIPSGSGQALATLPIMIPVGDLLTLTRQTTILAFQIGDGVTNLFNPSLGGLIAMLAMCRIPFDRWIRFIFPFVLLMLMLSWVFLLISVYINWT